MAYFRCSLGGGSGNGAVITVTYGAEFYNQTLVATNGTDTVSVLASSSGTADITVPSEGSWVISCTIGADTYTSDPVLVDLSYATELISIPNGSTVTPTDDIQTWLLCAGIRDKSYTTLGEVLADEDTYINLLADSNACDYMARSTTWAVAQGLVPTMTDNTHPSGECFSSSNYSASYPAYKAFDTDNSTAWASTVADAVGSSIGYDFGTSVVVSVVKIVDNNTASQRPTNVTIQGYDTEWHDIDTFSRSQQTTTNSFANSTAYTKYRVVVNAFGGTQGTNNVNISEIQFYTDTDITTNADAMRLLGMYDYACDVLLSDSTWCTAICNSTYFESVLDVKIPVMTSDTAPSGTASASSVYAAGTYSAYKAFDNNTNTFWLSSNSGGGDSWLQYEFPAAIRLAKVRLYIAKSNTGKQLYLNSITGANDGAATTLFDTQTLINSSSQATTTIIPITNSGSYSKIRLNTSISGAGSYADEVQFYGRHTAQTDIIVSAPSDTIYYMDNGSPVTLCTTDTDGIGSVDWSDLPTGDITLYSSVAKDPDDLTADYGKSIYVSKYKTQAYLMPKKTLYWWGYESSDLQDCTSANGWTPYSGYSFTAPTHNTNSISCTGANNTISAVGTKNIISGTTAYMINTGVTMSNNYGSIGKESSKTTTFGSFTPVSSSSIAKYSIQITTNYVLVEADGASRANILHAFWYE